MQKMKKIAPPRFHHPHSSPRLHTHAHTKSKKMADDTDEEHRDTDEDNSKLSADSGGGAHHNRLSREVFGSTLDIEEAPLETLRKLQASAGPTLTRDGRPFVHIMTDGSIRSADGSSGTSFAATFAAGRPTQRREGNYNMGELTVSDGQLAPSTRMEVCAEMGKRGANKQHAHRRVGSDGVERSVHWENSLKGRAVSHNQKKAVVEVCDNTRSAAHGKAGVEMEVAEGPFYCTDFEGIRLRTKWDKAEPLKVVTRCCGGEKDGPWTKEVIVSHLRQIDDSTAKRGKVESAVWKISPIKIEIDGAPTFVICHCTQTKRSAKPEICGVVVDKDGNMIVGTGTGKDLRFIRSL